MKIVRHPYHASILPHPGKSGRSGDTGVPQAEPTNQGLWHCVIRRDGSAEIVSRHDARRKEDAACVAQLELVRLQRSSKPARQVS